MDQSKRTTYIIAAIAFVAILVGIYFLFIFQKGPERPRGTEGVGEVKALNELTLKDRPYVTLTPTSDGAEIIVSIENMAAFEKIEYELTYLSDNPQVPGEKIQRGATGTDINTRDQKYKKSVLLGTASRGVRSPDKGITDGKLLLHLFRGDTQYDSETNWDLVQVGSRRSTITDRGGKFKLQVLGFTNDYWVIITETVGVPKPQDFDIQKVVLPSYGVFSIAPKFAKKGDLSITLEDGTGDYTLYIYNHGDSTWGKPDSSYNKSTKTLTSQVEFFSTFIAVAK